MAQARPTSQDALPEDQKKAPAADGGLDDLLNRLEDDLSHATPVAHGPVELATKVPLDWEEGGLWNAPRASDRKVHDEQKLGPAIARVVEDLATRTFAYEVEEPVLSIDETAKLAFLEGTLIATLRGYPLTKDLDAKRAFLRLAIDKIIAEYRVALAPEARERVTYFVERDFLGFGVIDVLMRDAQLEDISCDGPDIPIYVFHRKHGSLRSNLRFPDDKTLDGFIIRMAQASGKHISIANPILDATLPDRSRLQATLAREITPRGSSFTIRRFRDKPVSPIELLAWGTVSPVVAAFFWMLMEEGRSMLTAGGTASGKTTSLNAWSIFIPREKKIVSIEDTRELNIPHENWIAGVARQGFGDKGEGGKAAGTIDTFKLLEAAMRQRPEYIIVGEVRGQEAFTLFQAMATGHATYATMHADSAHSAVRRLENPPINVPRIMIASLDCLSVQFQTRVHGRAARRVKEVVEFLGIDNESGELLTNTLFRWDPRTDKWVHGLKSYIIERIAEARGQTQAEINAEWHRRALFLDAMHRRGILDHAEVSRIIAAYRAFPEETFKTIVGENPT